jgi:hypothetical protein
MSARRFGTQSLVRLLGNWQESSSRTPLWRQLAEALRLLILDGRLTLQTRLPGERELAAALNVSRTTIASALGQLREEGFLYSRQGAGRALFCRNAPPTCRCLRHLLYAESLYRRPQRRAGGPSGLPACHDPAAALSRPDRLRSAGLPVLREAIARRYSERGLPTRPDEVMVVNGALSAFALILRLFTGPGDRVVIDDLSDGHQRHSGRLLPPGRGRASAAGMGLRWTGGDYCADRAASGVADAGFSQPHRALYGCPHPPAGRGHRRQDANNAGDRRDHGRPLV